MEGKVKQPLLRRKLHGFLSTRSKLLDKIGNAGLRFYLYRENNYFDPDLNGEHWLLNRLKGLGFSPKNILDIGANEGRWTAYAGAIWPTAQFDLFDPAVDVAARLRERFGKSKQHRIHQCAVGGEDGEVGLSENREVSSHSFVTKKLEVSSEDGSVTRAKMVTGPEAMRLAGVDHIDLCKIDAEGFDLAIIQSFEAILKQQKIGILQFEHHALAVSYGIPFGTISTLFRDCGYTLTKIYPNHLREVEYGLNSWAYSVGPNFCAFSQQTNHFFERLR